MDTATTLQPAGPARVAGYLDDGQVSFSLRRWVLDVDIEREIAFNREKGALATSARCSRRPTLRRADINEGRITRFEEKHRGGSTGDQPQLLRAGTRAIDQSTGRGASGARPL